MSGSAITLEHEVGAAADVQAATASVPAGRKSHHAYAVRTLDHLSVKGWKPVFHLGELYVLSEAGIWVPYDKRDLQYKIAELHDGKFKCITWSDYTGIAEQACSIAADSSFFEGAPVGIAYADSFYRVDGDGYRVEPLGPHHRQRVMLDWEPREGSTPHFTDFLHQTFRSEVEGEEEEQQRLVQEIAGAVLLGIMPRYQKAVLFYDPYGRAGKGTLERIIRKLVPEDFITAVSPFKWDKEYYLARLAGSRLNVVGELPEGESIPSASFKSVLGGDLLAGRHPTKPVISFQNEAAHIFTSNYLISTRDQSEAFYQRWLLVDFPNSLLRTGQTPDPDLETRIVSNELPGIAHWALQGGQRLLKQGRFSTSIVHDRLMEKWRRSSNALAEFIFECCEQGPDLHERRSAFYKAYVNWCQANTRKPAAKGRVKEQMEHTLGLKVRFAVLDGIEIVRGIAFTESFSDQITSL